MELSSFQLEPLQVSPHIALVTNVTPNHLDRHPSMEAYWAAKGQILAHQAADRLGGAERRRRLDAALSAARPRRCASAWKASSTARIWPATSS